MSPHIVMTLSWPKSGSFTQSEADISFSVLFPPPHLTVCQQKCYKNMFFHYTVSVQKQTEMLEGNTVLFY